MYVECVVCLYNLKMCGGVVSEGVRSLCRGVCKCKVCVRLYMYVCVQRYVYR